MAQPRRRAQNAGASRARRDRGERIVKRPGPVAAGAGRVLTMLEHVLETDATSAAELAALEGLT